jgi:tetratricopeptide (TPR) repeat protein
MSSMQIKRHLQIKFTLFAFFTLLLLAPGEFSQVNAEDAEEEVDYLSLAALMIKDGHYDRAEVVLDQVDQNDADVDFARYYVLRGLVLLKKERFKESRTDFEKAIAAGQKEPIVQVYLAQARFGVKDYRAAITALDAAGDSSKSNPDLFILKAQCHWELGEYQAAWNSLESGLSIFSNHSMLLRVRVFYLIELQLYQEALDYSRDFLTRDDATDQDSLAIAQALIKSNQANAAVLLLEAAHLRYPRNIEIMLALAHAYHSSDMPLASARLFEKAAAINPEFAFETAELYRNANRPSQALYWNAQVDDQKKKIRQRLGLFLQSENFEMAATLEPRLSRLGLLEDEDIRYALAYALYKIHEFSRAEAHLKFLTRSELFTNANTLRQAMENCRAQAWECYE